jgi:hypothetical protein
VHLSVHSISFCNCISKLARSWLQSAYPNWLDHGLPVYLQTRWITAFKCISEFTQFRSPSVSPNSLDHGLPVHLQTRSITAFKCISEFTQSGSPSASQTRSITASQYISILDRSQPPSVSLSSLDLNLQVHLQTGSIEASKYIVKKREWVSGDTMVTEVECATQSIYSGVPGVDRQHLMFISSCHTMTIHTLSFPTFGLTCSFRDFVDPHSQVVLYVLTFFLPSSSLM